MKVAIYSPYLDTLGGGERYIATIAEILSSLANVDLLLDDHLYSLGNDKLIRSLSNHFGLNLKKVSGIKAPLGKNSNFLERLFFLKKYDVLFYLTDGSIFYPTARKNILHIQSPLTGQPSKSLWGRLKLSGWSLIIYNSKFTQKNTQDNWPLKSEVIYPPVDVENIKPLKKRNYILSVGRFFGYLRGKKHELMINAFKDLFNNKKIDNWSLHLVGGASEGDKLYLDELKEMTNGLPVRFYPNLDYSSLIRLYGESTIYWHTMGFGESDPIKMEHFGISVVEAMAGGCIPVVISKGGLTEIVKQNVNGFLWNNLNELKNFTIKLMRDQNLRNNLSKKAQEKAKDFSKKRFKEKIIEIVNS